MKHYTDKISDYVLGMLDSAEIPRLEKHAQACEKCRSAIAQERQLLTQIGATFAAVPQPSHAHLMSRMPAPPKRHQTFSQTWQRAVTAMAMAVFLLIGGVSLRPTISTPIASPAPSLVALTSTATTIAPTSTPTQLAQGVFATPVPEPVNGY